MTYTISLALISGNWARISQISQRLSWILCIKSSRNHSSICWFYSKLSKMSSGSRGRYFPLGLDSNWSCWSSSTNKSGHGSSYFGKSFIFSGPPFGSSLGGSGITSLTGFIGPSKSALGYPYMPWCGPIMLLSGQHTSSTTTGNILLATISKIMFGLILFTITLGR